MPLTVEYDPYLIVLSIAVAVVGSYAGLFALRGVHEHSFLHRRLLLVVAALTIGASIWSMHFIGMLAVSLPVIMSYDILITLISALVSILVTGLGISFAVYGQKRGLRILVGGIFMGLGVSCMHYIGMGAIRANCAVTYDPILVVVSVAVGILASILALWLVGHGQHRWPLVLASLAMGLAISGMHYAAMASTSFLPTDYLLETARPVIDPTGLAFTVALSTFLLLGYAILCSLPTATSRDIAVPSSQENLPEPVSTDYSTVHLPVERNNSKLFLDSREAVAIKANGRYTSVHTADGVYFCTLSISELDDLLYPMPFLRVHRSYIVRLPAIRSFEAQNEQGCLTVLSGKEPILVPVSRSNIGQLRKAMQH